MKSPLEQNYYELLEVPRDATLAEIDRAYDRARAYYGVGSAAVYTLASVDEQKRVQDHIDEAYLILGDEKARSEYDARIGPPGPDERPLHRDLRLAREQEAARREAERQAALERAVAEKSAAEKSVAEKPSTAAPPAEPPIAAPPAEPPIAEPPIAAPEIPGPPAAPERAPEPSKPAVDGPVPPPAMAAPEPAPTRLPAERPSPAPVAEPAPSASPAPKLEALPADAVFGGELLRQVREGRGLTVQDIADRTKIGKPHLENIEADRYAALPAQVYLRGFLMSLARELKLDPLRVSKSYLDQVAAAKGASKPRS